MYRDGLGLKQDDVEAYKWFTLSADQSDGEATRARDHLAARMDVTQIAEAEQRAEEWRE